MRGPLVANLPAAVILLAIAGLLVHLEIRASAQAHEVRALREDVMAQHAGPGAPREAPALRAPPVTVRYGMDSDTVQAVARAVVQVESQRAAASASASADGDGRQPPPRSIDEETAVADASEVARQAIARGRLSRDDVTHMRRELGSGQATEAERDAVRSQIAMALNAQKLVPEDPRFVYP